MAKPTILSESDLAKRRERMRQYYKDNKEKMRAAGRQYYQDNKEKLDAANRQWAQENRDKDRAAKRRWREKNPEKAAAAIRLWRENNPGKERASARKWNEENKERRDATIRQWQQENPGKVRAARRLWGKNHPDKARANYANRRSRKIRQMPAWAVIADLKIAYTNCPAGMQVDHIVPLRGITFDGYRVSGLHVPWNLQYLTPEENCQKYNRMRPADHEAAGAPVEMPRQLSLF